MTRLPTNILHPLKLTVLRLQEDEHDYHFHVEAPSPAACESCGVVGELVRFGKADQSYRDVPIHGKRVTLWLQRRRYKCKACGGTFRPTLPDMDEKRFMTKRLVAHVEKAVLYRTNTDVAKECGLEEKTVRQVFNDFCDRQQEKLDFITPRVLGVDEIYMQRQFRCVLTNIEESTVLDLLPNRSLELVKQTFHGLPEKEAIEIVSIDMYRNYLDAAYEALPHALVVIDKFHVVKMANEAMEAVRLSFRKELSTHDRRTLKNDRRLLLMRERDLSPMQKLVVGQWLDRFPALDAAYTAKEGFFKLYDAADMQGAIAAYDEWCQSLPKDQSPWQKLMGTVSRWRGPIFNYFKVGARVTNAFTESANRAMKDLNRSTRGMSFEAFRAKVLLGAQHKIVRARIPRASSPFEGGGMMGRVTPGMFDSYDEYEVDFGIPISTVLAILEGREP